ncbi:MAG: SURF1 family protein [Chloroflexi bacterium]|nr:SURF1 family protein [Chloroflexota bacterium]
MDNKLITFPRIIGAVLVLIAAGVCVRLGIWQLDRLGQRRALNAHLRANLSAQPLNLNALPVPDDLSGQQYRQVVITGVFDYSQQMTILNQDWKGEVGNHLLIPLILQGSQQAVLVDRGWIPEADATPGKWEKYNIQGTVTLTGQIRQSQDEAAIFGLGADQPLAPGAPRRIGWTRVNIGQIAQQTTLSLLPVYIVQAPDAGSTALPYRSLAQPDLSEGPHLGYAIQWFVFAILFIAGYPYVLWKRMQEKKRPVFVAED